MAFRPTATSLAHIVRCIGVVLCTVAVLLIVVEQGLGGETENAPIATTKTARAPVRAPKSSDGAASIQQSSHTFDGWLPSNSDSAAASAQASEGLQLRSIGELGVNIAVQSFDDAGRALLLPPGATAESSAVASHEDSVPDWPRPWPVLDYHWEATQLCHRALYFEEINLERYGHSLGCVQPLVSAAHFYGTVAAMPAKLVLEPPCQCVSTLGHFRPGDCVPFEWYHPRPRCDREVVTHCCFGKLLRCGKLWYGDVWNGDTWDELY